MQHSLLSAAEEIGIDFCLKSRCYPVALESGTLTVATEKYEELLIEAIEFRTRKSVNLVEVPGRELEVQIKSLSSAGATSETILSQLNKNDLAIGDEVSIEELKEKSQAEPVIKLVKDIIDQSIAEGATDIHIEPMESTVKVRYRKDGMLLDKMELPKWVQLPVVSRLKILAELDIAEKRLPHDGRIKWPTSTESIDMRVSTLPTRLGEKVVIRILKHTTHVADISKLGMPERILTSIKQVIHKPQGIFFVTGPTGSGKSSTLYAALKEIIHKNINICTIEDPIEYRLDGANQVQVNEKAGLTFSRTLRSLLRQDPDVMLVGEIRDEETAFMALQAAQTGHLVFSTLHTNDSASAITRLMDLRVKPFLISSALLGIMAQRLVRVLCVHCKKMVPTKEEDLAVLPSLPKESYGPEGCEQCGYTGYKGRIGVFECLMFTSEIRKAVGESASEQTLKELSKLIPLFQDGLHKLKQGITSVSEILRVIAGEGENL